MLDDNNVILHPCLRVCNSSSNIHCKSNRKMLMTTFKLVTLLFAVAVFTTGTVQAQNGPAPQALTAAEQAKMKKVLTPYKSANLTADDAKAIKRGLRDAGLHRSRELDAALSGAGFSAEKMDALDPPPPRPPGDGPTPPQK
jgi:hypothetical protein